MQRVASTAAQRIGDDGEDLAAARLEAAGWTLLARNLRLGRDEVDLLGVDPGPPAALVIVEVRRRGRRDFGLAEETLDRRKRMALRRACGHLLETGTLPDGRRLPALPLRVDLVAIDPGPDGLPSVRHHRGIRP
jgi:putative endonuclease